MLNHLLLVNLTTRADGSSKVLQYSDGVLPVDAGISDGDTTLEGRRTLSGDLLVALADVGLDHDTDNCLLTLTELISDSLGDLGLVVVVLLGVPIYSTMRQDIHKCPSMHFEQRTTHDCSQS